jgi:membrane-bound lytic murein transglycosylase MltF
MKTRNKITTLILMGGLLMISLTVKPNTKTITSPGAIETEKTIKDYFKFPQIVIPVNESQKVEVLFTTNANGHVDFVLAKTKDQNLKAEIEKQFLKLNLDKIKSNVVHSVTLNIKTV